jgi:erythrin-vacuolar iron transport family protein
MKRDFSSLTAQEALGIAITVEERNAFVYHQLGDMFSQFCADAPTLASSFFELESAERRHGALLMSRYVERFGTLTCNISEEDIRSFIEVPRYDVDSVLTAVEKGQPGSARHIALEIAAAAEQSAVQYYSHIAATTLDPELKSLYEEFVALEQEHSDWLDIELEAEKIAGKPS